MNQGGTILPGDTSGNGNSGRPLNTNPGAGRLRPGDGTQGTDLGNNGLGNNGQNTGGNPPPGSGIDTPQPDRSKYDTWPQDVEVLRAETVYFDFDKSSVKRSEVGKVAKIAEYLKGHPGHMVKLDGHADERGTEEYNRALGERRALGVREQLLNLGISSESVVTATYGEDRPADLGHNEAAWSKNRRAEPVVLIPPGSTR